MNAKVIITVCLLLAIGLLKSDASYGSYDVAVNAPNTPKAPDGEYYNPEVYLADAYDADSEYTEPPDDAKHYEMDIMFGAFKIITKPKGADINLYDSDMYLSESPSPVYPVIMDESMELREGIPGRTITLMITKEGYKPMKKDIFVPFLYQSQERALKNPSVFKFDLKRDRDRSHVSICFYYSYANRHHRHRVHHGWFGPPSYYPWCPPGFIGWYYPPRPPHYHGPYYGYGYWTPNPPPPPPGGGHHGGYNPPPGNPGDGGSGSHGNYPPHHDLPIPPPDGNGGGYGTHVGALKPTEKPVQPSSVAVVHAKPNLSVKPDQGSGNGNIGSAASASNVNKVPGKITITIPSPQKVNGGGSFSETPKPRPKPESRPNNVQVSPKPQPQREAYRAPSKPKPQPEREAYRAPSKPKPQPEREAYRAPSKPKPEKPDKIDKPAIKEKNDNPKPKNNKTKSDEDTNPKEDDTKKLQKYVKA